VSAQPAQKSTDLALPDPKALTLQQRVLAAVGARDESALQKLADGTKDITVITNPAGYQQVHAARMVLKNERIAIEKDCKKAREDAVAFGKAVIVEEKRLIGIISTEEDRLEKLQETWDDAREAERQAKAAAEAKRVADIQARIDEIRQYPLNIVGISSANIESILKTVVEIAIDDTFAELKQQAEGAKATTLIRLRAALANAQAMEAEQARLAAERVENERVRKENEAKAAADRARLAEEERVAREAREQEAAELRAATELNQMRMSEIQGIQHQVFIATTGRLGVRKGGTRECIVETLLETEGWEVSEEKFGPLLPMAREAKISAISQITEIRDRWDRRIAEAAERAETERVEAKRRVAADAEAQRLAAERAQLERDQEALRIEREKPAIVTTVSEGADIREDSVRQARDTPCDALSQPVDKPAAESGSVAPTAEQPADLMTIRLTEWLPMDAVCKAAKEWAVFQHRDSKLDQKKDRKLAQQAREAEANLLAVVEQLP
jgi:hypothetical protein